MSVAARARPPIELNPRSAALCQTASRRCVRAIPHITDHAHKLYVCIQRERIPYASRSSGRKLYSFPDARIRLTKRTTPDQRTPSIIQRCGYAKLFRSRLPRTQCPSSVASIYIYARVVLVTRYVSFASSRYARAALFLYMERKVRYVCLRSVCAVYRYDAG